MQGTCWQRSGWGRSSRLAALSLMGISCASLTGATRGGPGGGDRSGSGPGAGGGDGRGAAPTLLSETALGPLTIRKWRLHNGLEVILLPDPAATSVAYMTWFRVGSRDERAEAQETGLAHLFEHLMFTQTVSARSPGEFDRKMEEAGASTNAMTYYDFTAYVDELPPQALPVAVTLEADRMSNLALTDQQVLTEREVVAEERLGAVEDSVDGMLDELMYGRAFRRHPYRYPVIGRMADIKAVTRAKATAFYRKFYAPNNAVVVVTGRFDAAAALAQIARAYGPIPASATLGQAGPEIAPERAPTDEIREEIERPVPADRLLIGFPAPALGSPDRAAFEVLDEILTGGPSARLHRRLVVETALASSVDASPAATRDPGLYSVWVQLRKGHHAAEAEKIIDAELATLTAREVSPADLSKAKNRMETAFWRGLSSSEGKANQLGEFEVVAGDYRKLLGRAEEIAAVSAAEVLRVARDYLGGRTRVVMVARPKTKGRAEDKDKDQGDGDGDGAEKPAGKARS
jgi:zinc protease